MSLGLATAAAAVVGAAAVLAAIALPKKPRAQRGGGP
jgi:hypothetical protein